MSNLDLSVIIPMYNVEKFIIPLLEDLMKQEVKGVEFLLVNDGSTDNTVELIKNFLKNNNDRRFILINKENGGVSAARNYGLRLATGKYVIFIDADDHLNKNFLKEYLRRIKQNNTDIEIFSATRIDTSGNITGKIDYSSIVSQEAITSEKLIKYLCTGKAYGFLFSYIFKKSIWSDVRFKEGLCYEEDLLAIVLILLKNPNIKIHANEESYYYYLNNNKGATNTIEISTLYSSLYLINKLISEMVEKSGQYYKLKNYVLNMRLNSLIFIIQLSSYNNKDYYYRISKKEFLYKIWKLKYISIKIMVKRVVQSILLLFNNKTVFKKMYIRSNR